MDGLVNPGQSYRGSYSNLPQGVSNAGAGNNNAYTRQVNPNELTSYNLANLLDQNGQYIQQARQSGMNTANDRGMLNSSIAAGNSQQAAIQAGLPIAQQDASAYGAAAGQNLDALNQILATRMNNNTSLGVANIGAGASMYNADRDYQASQNNLAYQGQQAGLNRGFQDYMAQQGFGNQMRRDAFNLGGNLLQGDSNFNHSLYLQQANDPFAMANPQALQGYSDWANQNNSSYYDNLFGYATNGGQSTGNWREDSPWYTSPYGP